MKPITIAVALLGLLALPIAATAHPARIIILRHAEKLDALQLCGIGQQRAAALAQQYLGKNATESLMVNGPPAAFYSTTLHTLETLVPSVQSWRMSQRTYASAAPPGMPQQEKDAVLNRATRRAVAEIMSDPSFTGRTVVMAWEHRHIADQRMEAKYPGQIVTLRQALHLHTLVDVPTQWSKGNFDYFWIVDFADAKSDRPTGFRMLLQQFTGQYAALPQNLWNTPERLAPGRCLQDDNEF